MSTGTFELVAEKGRQVTWSIPLYDDSATAVNLATADCVRFKAGRRPSATPDIELNSTDNTSNLTFTNGDNTVTLTLLPSDTSSLNTGPYSCELLVIDESASDAVLSAQQGVLRIVPTLGGSVADVP